MLVFGSKLRGLYLCAIVVALVFGSACNDGGEVGDNDTGSDGVSDAPQDLNADSDTEGDTGGGVEHPPLRAVPVDGGIGYFVDPLGREVLLRGVNVNSLGEYWQYDASRITVFPFEEEDMDFIASMGFNLVRLIVTWSFVEPQPGVYDDDYIDGVLAVIDGLWARGIYTLVDMHQDAWGPALAARQDEVCPAGTTPAAGWDGAPAWATLVDEDTPRCAPLVNGFPVRELSSSVIEAWTSFMRDAIGPGDVGIRTRFNAMWRHLASRVSTHPGVMGYDVLNEPNIFAGLDFSELYRDALPEIRAGEAAAGSAERVVVFEPSAGWNLAQSGWSVRRFTEDTQVAYGPHIYQGSISDVPLDEGQISRIRSEVQGFGGVPVVVGEWGAGYADADNDDGYFARMIALQDREGWSMAHWVYMAACGDPHHAYTATAGDDSGEGIWSYRHVDCDEPNERGPLRTGLVNRMRRPALHYAPGAIDAIAWDPVARTFDASGVGATENLELVWFAPEGHTDLQVELTGLSDHSALDMLGGTRHTALAEGGAWSISAAP